MRKAQHADEKAMMEIAQANKKLAEPLKHNQKQIEELSVELKNYQKVCVSGARLFVSFLSCAASIRVGGFSAKSYSSPAATFRMQ